MRPFSPADSEKILTWTRPKGGGKQTYSFGMSGGYYRSLEARLRDNGKGVWLIAWDYERERVVATLGLDTGGATGERGVFYDKNGEQQTTGWGTPKWASKTGGRCLIWVVPILYQGQLEYRPHSKTSGSPAAELVWVTEEGNRFTYRIRNSDEDYRYMELRERDDGQAVWIVDRQRKKTVAALEFGSGRFAAADGTIFGQDGRIDSSRHGFPSWASPTGGRERAYRRLR